MCNQAVYCQDWVLVFGKLFSSSEIFSQMHSVLWLDNYWILNRSNTVAVIIKYGTSPTKSRFRVQTLLLVPGNKHKWNTSCNQILKHSLSKMFNNLICVVSENTFGDLLKESQLHHNLSQILLFYKQPINTVFTVHKKRETLTKMVHKNDALGCTGISWLSVLYS